MPLVSLPAAPASERKHAVYAVKHIGSRAIIQNLIAIEIRHRNLGGRNEPVVRVLVLAPCRALQIRFRGAEQIFCELRQLARPEQAAAVHDERRKHLGIPVLPDVHVEHEIGQRPLQPGARAHVDREPRPAQLGRALQVQDSQVRPQLPVRLRLKIELPPLAPSLDDDVVLFRPPHRNLVPCKVRDARQRKPHRLIEPRGLGIQLVQRIFELARLVHQSGSIQTLPLGPAHLLAQLVAHRLQRLSLGNGQPPLQIERAKIPQQRRRIGSPRAQLLFHQGQISPNKIQIEHDSPVYRTLGYGCGTGAVRVRYGCPRSLAFGDRGGMQTKSLTPAPTHHKPGCPML